MSTLNFNEYTENIGTLSGIDTINFVDSSVNSGVVITSVATTFDDNSENSGTVTSATFSGSSTNSGNVSSGLFLPLSANSTVTNNGVIDVALIGSYPQSIVNNGTINYARFTLGEENIVNNGTINVSAYNWGHVWPNPADVTQILVDPYYGFVGYNLYGSLGEVPITAIYVPLSSGITSLGGIAETGALYYVNPLLSHHEVYHPHQLRSGYAIDVVNGNLLYFLSGESGGGHIYNGVSPFGFGHGWIINGVLSNLDYYGNNTFYADRTVIGGTVYTPGTYDTWNGQFYQAGIPYTGTMEYNVWAINQYGIHYATGETSTINFVNGFL